MFQRAFIDLYVGGEFSGVFEASTVQVDTLLGTNIGEYLPSWWL